MTSPPPPPPRPVWVFIQARNWVTRANTVNNCLASHRPDPQLTAPWRVYVFPSAFRHTYGPPLSPWQPLKMVSSTPAHSICEVKAIGTKKTRKQRIQDENWIFKNKHDVVVWCPAGDSPPSSSKITYDHDHFNDNVNDNGAPRARERSSIAKKIW